MKKRCQVTFRRIPKTYIPLQRMVLYVEEPFDTAAALEAIIDYMEGWSGTEEIRDIAIDDPAPAGGGGE